MFNVDNIIVKFESERSKGHGQGHMDLFLKQTLSSFPRLHLRIDYKLSSHKCGE